MKDKKLDIEEYKRQQKRDIEEYKRQQKRKLMLVKILIYSLLMILSILTMLSVKYIGESDLPLWVKFWILG